jgi:hypothetical protein
MPLVLSVLPALGLSFLSFLNSEWIEWSLFLSSAAIGSTSIHLGTRTHGKRKALWPLGAGLTMLAIGRYGHEHSWGWLGVGALVVGGCSVFLAHLVNARLCASCRSCH